MVGELIITNLENACKGFSTNRKVTFDPRTVHRALETTAAMKARQIRNINLLLNSPRFKNLTKLLQKEIDFALTK